jgi:hypothetical protein
LHLWLDVAGNVAAKLISQFVTVEFIIPQVGPYALAIEPLIHGGVNGAVKSQLIDTDSISSLGAFTRGVENIEGRQTTVRPPLSHYTFENGFLEGSAYNAASIAGGMGIDKFISMM